MNLSSPELERTALAACLMYPGTLLQVPLTEQDFYTESHRVVWNALVWLQAEGRPVGTLNVFERLEMQGLGKKYDLSFLTGLVDCIPPTDPPTRRLRELTRLRALDVETRKLLAACAEGDIIKAQALAAGLQILGTDAIDAEILTAWDCAETVLEELAGRSKRVLDVHPGLPIMAEALGDLPIGSLTILGADTNVGKSSIALEMLVHAAQRNVCGAYISREDPRVLIGRRFLSMLSGISARKIRKREITDYDWPKLATAAATLQHMGGKLLVDQRRGGTELDACAAMTRAAQRGARLVVIDYLQAIELSSKVQDRRNEVSKVAARIAAHGERVGVATVALSQLTIPQGQEGKEPGKHWLKESRDLTNMADNIVLAWRKEEAEFAPIFLKLSKGKDGGLNQRWTMQRNDKTGRLEELGWGTA